MHIQKNTTYHEEEDSHKQGHDCMALEAGQDRNHQKEQGQGQDNVNGTEA